MLKVEGSCLCGSVSYSSTEEPLMTAVCHCKNCQKQTGTAFSILVGVPESSIEFGDKENLAEYLDKGDSGGVVRRKFCRNCGSPILSLVEVIPGVGFIKAGTLKDSSWLKPTTHFWCDTAQPWVEIANDVEKHSKNPS